MNPPSTRYTGQRATSRLLLFATLAVAGLSAATAATPRTYRYFRFSQTALRNPTTPLIQLSEFRFYNGNTALPMAGVTVTNPGGHSPDGEDASKLVDGNTGTKWLDVNKQPVVFDFGAPVTADRYDFSTANDDPDRDPVSWTLDGSDDGSTWAPLDVVKDNSTPTWRQLAAAQLATKADAFTLDPVAIGEFHASRTVIFNNDLVELTWTTANADSVSINQGIGAVAASDTTTPPPLAVNAETTFTLTGTNNVDGNHTATATVRSVAGGASNFRYVRFTPTKLRNDNLTSAVQLAELRFLDGVTVLTPVSVANPGGLTPPNEGPDKLNDDDFDSKWLDLNKQGVIYDFGATIQFDGYYLVTANDALERDPLRWTIEGSDDQATWTLVENMTTFDFPLTIGRKSFTQDIPLPGASLKPIVQFNGDAPALISGQPLHFTWSTQGAATVTLDNGVGSVSSSGSLDVTPVADTTYTLTATSSAGIVTTASFAVDVVTPAITTIAYQNFNGAGDELGLIGDAEVLNDFANIPAPGNFDRLRLTSDTTSQAGTSWFRKRMNLAAGFQTFFDLQFVTLGGTPGADGISFIIQNAPQGTASVPTGGAEDGLAANALNLKFDSFDNGDGDPSSAVVEVRAGTNVLATADLTTFPALLPLPGNDPNDLTMNSGSTAPYKVRVDYLPGNLDVYFNDVLVLDSINVELSSIGAVDGNGTGYVGFSSRTGTFFEAHDVTRWLLTEGPPVAPPAITNFAFNFTSDSLQLTWSSSPARSYRVTTSTNGSDWSTILASGIAGAAGPQTTTNVNFTQGTIGLFRVEEE